jgi:hypothetical protein
MVYLDRFHYHFTVYANLVVRATIRDTSCVTNITNCHFKSKSRQKYILKRYSICINVRVRFVCKLCFQNVFKQHHRRFNILLGKTVDLKE